MKTEDFAKKAAEWLAKAAYEQNMTVSVCATTCGFVGPTLKEKAAEVSMSSIMHDAVLASAVYYCNVLGEETTTLLPIKFPVDLLETAILKSCRETCGEEVNVSE